MADHRRFAWTWSTQPINETEFDHMMVALDRHLTELGLLPNLRGLKAALVVSSTWGLSGAPLWGGRDRDPMPFGPSDVLDRVQEWYAANYDEFSKINWSPGSVVVFLHKML